MEQKHPDLFELYQRYWSESDKQKGLQAEIRRVATPEALAEVPAFYRLTRGYAVNDRLQRLVFCLPHFKHQEQGNSLGKALATGSQRISEKRLFMVIRSGSPNDVIQLRRLLQQSQPTVNAHKAVKHIYFWKERDKQKILEDFFLHQTEPN